VWTAALEEKEKRPAMLWIHGGGFEFGGSEDPRYDGAHMATKCVVVASINYRLGAFGYLALPQLDHGKHKSGNFGLQDIIAALKWVRTHIDEFGGDPDRITLWGESGGAHAIGLLMASPLTKSLFHQAIMESGAFWESEHGEASSFEQARQLGEIFTQRVGVTSEEDLRALPASVVNQAEPWDPATDPGTTAYSPSIDDYVLTDNPSNVFREGKQLKIPVLAGINAKEELILASRALPIPNLTTFLSEAELVFESKTPDFLALYPAATLADATASALALDGDLIIREQTQEAIDYTYLNADQPVWAYHFTYSSAYSPVPLHTAELPFIYGNLVIDQGGPPTAADYAFSDKLVAYWSNFAKTGSCWKLRHTQCNRSHRMMVIGSDRQIVLY
jgi:para-nitrobenzyl esterase